MKSAIETAYCFLHQKERVYRYSTMEWQREDIEYAIAQYVETMPRNLYEQIAGGKDDFLLDHSSFGQDMQIAVERLETMMA